MTLPLTSRRGGGVTSHWTSRVKAGSGFPSATIETPSSIGFSNGACSGHG
jgi:hypothetical protein